MATLRKSTKAFEDAASDAATKRELADYVLRLYIAGTSPGSTRAVATLKALCESRLKGRYKLEVIDVYQQPLVAKEAQIVAVPTLIKSLPLPLRRVIGDLSDTRRVLSALDLKVEDA